VRLRCDVISDGIHISMVSILSMVRGDRYGEEGRASETRTSFGDPPRLQNGGTAPRLGRDFDCAILINNRLTQGSNPSSSLSILGCYSGT
jgi:hypothetical protein